MGWDRDFLDLVNLSQEKRQSLNLVTLFGMPRVRDAQMQDKKLNGNKRRGLVSGARLVRRRKP